MNNVEVMKKKCLSFCVLMLLEVDGLEIMAECPCMVKKGLF